MKKRKAGKPATLSDILRDLKLHYRGIINGDAPADEKVAGLRKLEHVLHATLIVVGDAADDLEETVRRRSLSGAGECDGGGPPA